MSETPRRREPRDPYVPVSISELQDLDLPAEALLLLLRLRRECMRDLSDGVITQRTFESVAAYYGYERRNLSRNVRILSSAARLRAVSGTFLDTNFAQVCLTREQRLSQKERWRKAARTYRAWLSAHDSSHESADDSADERAGVIAGVITIPPSNYKEGVHLEETGKNGHNKNRPLEIGSPTLQEMAAFQDGDFLEDDRR